MEEQLKHFKLVKKVDSTTHRTIPFLPHTSIDLSILCEASPSMSPKRRTGLMEGAYDPSNLMVTNSFKAFD